MEVDQFHGNDPAVGETSFASVSMYSFKYSTLLRVRCNSISGFQGFSLVNFSRHSNLQGKSPCHASYAYIKYNSGGGGRVLTALIFFCDQNLCVNCNQ